MTRPFRFGLVAAPRGTGEQWVATARRAADLGFATLLAPDGVALHAPIPALAVAAAAVPGLRVLLQRAPEAPPVQPEPRPGPPGLAPPPYPELLDVARLQVHLRGLH